MSADTIDRERLSGSVQLLTHRFPWDPVHQAEVAEAARDLASPAGIYGLVTWRGDVAVLHRADFLLVAPDPERPPRRRSPRPSSVLFTIAFVLLLIGVLS